MTDTFKYDVDGLKKMMTQINKDQNTRMELKRQNKFTALKDQEIKGQLNKLESQYKIFNEFIIRMEKNPESYKVTNKEAERRKNMQFDIFNQINDLKQKIELSIKLPECAQIDLEMVKQQTSDYGENLTNKQLIQLQKENKIQQDAQLDSLIDVVQNVKHVAKGIGVEITEQEELIEDMDNNMSKNIRTMQKIRGNMARVMLKTSNCSLIICIIVQTILMILMLIYL